MLQIDHFGSDCTEKSSWEVETSVFKKLIPTLSSMKVHEEPQWVLGVLVVSTVTSDLNSHVCILPSPSVSGKFYEIGVFD